MRQHLIALALCASVAHAEKLDVSDAIGNVDVLRDETGKYYVMPKVFGEDAARKWTFYGDGRTMHLQRITIFAAQQGNFTLGLWSPRARGVPHAIIEKTKDGTTTLICRMRGSKHVRRPLTLVSEAAATKLLKTASFQPVLWQRRVFFFARGEGTKYYLVDMLRDEYGGEGFRLFVGPKGQMKQIAISDVANDTGGTAVTTKQGELRIDAKNGESAVWKHGKTMVALTRLDPQPNAFLIYRDLGVYGQLGAVCEDQ